MWSSQRDAGSSSQQYAAYLRFFLSLPTRPAAPDSRKATTFRVKRETSQGFGSAAPNFAVKRRNKLKSFLSGHAPSSEETTHTPFPAVAENSAQLRSFFLSPCDPLRWARMGTPIFPTQPPQRGGVTSPQTGRAGWRVQAFWRKPKPWRKGGFIPPAQVQLNGVPAGL